MSQSTKPCLFKETNGSYSDTVMRILVITIALSMGLSVLGVSVSVFNGFQEDDFEYPLIPENKPIEKITSEEGSPESSDSEEQSTEGKPIGSSSEQTEDIPDATNSGPCDVSVPESGSFGPYDTERGTMEIVDMKLPTEPLPLCIDNEYLQDFSITVRTTGGYEPKGGWITVTQGQGDKKECRGFININYDDGTKVEGECCTTYDYVLTFTVDRKICLESNHVPANPLGDFCVWPDKTLDKEVFLCVQSIWQGCLLDEQEFMVILAHKTMSQNPKLPI